MHYLMEIPFKNDLKLASFDITNMYTNIPTHELTDIIKFLFKQNSIDPTTQTELNEICNTILTQNYFRFSNIQCSQKQGLVMGAPSSSILPQVYLHFLENTQIYNILIQHQIIGYFRYVDDILIVYSDENTDIHKVLDLFNNISPTLTFTIEKEQNNSINFLDISIHKNQKLYYLQKTYHYRHHHPKWFKSSHRT